jgi:hypothetical protein
MALGPREAILERLCRRGRVLTSRRDDNGWASSSGAGWRAYEMAGGGVDSPERDQLPVDMAWWWSHELWAGGRVTGAGHDEAGAMRQRGRSWMRRTS